MNLTEEVAYAKVNLSLDVVSKRTDGFHDLRSVMQTISLHDTLSFWIEEGQSSVRGMEGADLSLIDKAIDTVIQAAGSSKRIAYAVEKHIPFAAGLGGGSSDAAAALRASARLLAVEVPLSELHTVAASLGSDVPFFVEGGTSLVEGRGEKMTPVGPLPLTWILLASEGISVSTRTVFEGLRMDEVGDGKATDRVMNGLTRGETVLGGNDLTQPALREFPGIAHTFAVLRQVATPDRIGMTGSGGTVMAMFARKEEASRAYEVVQPQVAWSTVASSVRTDGVIGGAAGIAEEM